jgi:glutamyl-tRNA synthetase
MEVPFGKLFKAFAGTGSGPRRVRLAPTPSGFLHAGNAVNFILNCLIAKGAPGSQILLRIDDLDAARKRPEYVEDIFRSLNWLGLEYDEGPENLADFEDNWSQYQRLQQYNRLLQTLRDTGRLFACSKSRSDLAGLNGVYPPEFRQQGLSLDDPDVAWRIRTPDGFPLPDFIVRRRDGVPAYQLASLADDLFFHITHIIRGADLEDSTAAQYFLAECLEETAFLNIQVLHHPLLTDKAGTKLSKSAGSESLRALRESGTNPSDVFDLTAGILGLPANQQYPDLDALLHGLDLISNNSRKP